MGRYRATPPRPSFSLGMTQIFKTPTPSPPRPIHPLLKGRKITERDEQRIRGWAVNRSLDSKQKVASNKGRPHLVLRREDLYTLRPRAWLNNNVVHWTRCAFNDSGLRRFTHDFYCVCLGILFQNGPTPVYVGLGKNFGVDTRYFDKVTALKRR
ncbi:hypothetical protein AHAS_Ahas05G0030800 [Arachis hypogaea]